MANRNVIYLLVVCVSLTTVVYCQEDLFDDTFGADPGCKDPWSTEWTRDAGDCTKVHFCVQGKKYWTISCNDTRVWSNTGHACVLPLSQWDDCNQVITTPTIIKLSLRLYAYKPVATEALKKDYPQTGKNPTKKSNNRAIPLLQLYTMHHCPSGYITRLFQQSDDERCVVPTGMNPDPDNCAQFLACDNRTVVATMSCPENTLFSTRNNTCELSYMVADECRTRQIPSHVSVTTASPIIDKPCEGTKNGDVSDPRNCARFYKCNYGRVVARVKCPSNSHFNDIEHKCDWRANVECGSRPK
ncbi:hypothetical protein LOTGIDRAFT_234723 [Lottia gigantea]|uniref:Chitin-binding type-2 domain-containing protein n=1 Tax=Lottia gigantea TaxID=225164 RepID=V3ZAZ9_LOTGI|nr:hypothetical protein LOTGIDRAFT_234723 [Lottia gigantea]ESO88173.1 hypothetical protein LOTGIDRAFT_234723 [Lottia gigantea]